jgi:hypothetical protein
MNRTVLMLILGAICFAGVAAATDSDSDPYSDIPRKDTPRKLQEAWLRFHESGLCQEVDAAFVFDHGGMQVWSRIESDKDYLKFQKMFVPLLAIHQVELYTNRFRKEKEPDNEDNPPPSLWQNYELRANLGERASQLLLYNETQSTINPDMSNSLLKQRLLIYAEQTLGRNRKIERYALDIFALSRLASDPDIPASNRSKAIEIASAHAKDLEKSIGKLVSDLEAAVPRPPKGEGGAVPPPPDTSKKQLLEAAEQLFENTQGVARRVHRFIYPEYYTVELEELRKPRLLESLRMLRQTVREFEKKLAKSGRVQTATRVEPET